MYMDNFTLIFMNIMQPISENYKKIEVVPTNVFKSVIKSYSDLMNDFSDNIKCYQINIKYYI